MPKIIKNPLSNSWYADPEARYYNGKYYIYVTHSLPFMEQLNQSCLVSSDLVDWEVKKDIIDMSGFPWVVGAVWAPTIIEKSNKYYLIFASNNIPHTAEYGGIEIAVSDDPEGPFKGYLSQPLISEFHNGAQPIDAHLFKDDDGTVYLFYGGWGHCNVAIMNDDMTGLKTLSNGETIMEITPPDYVEGPCMFKRDGKYYFMWSSGDWTQGTYRVNTAISNSPFGPFDNYSTILSTGNSTTANGPGHNGYLYIPELNRYLIVYHRHQNGVDSPHARFLCIDKMDIDENGNIKIVEMTDECII